MDNENYKKLPTNTVILNINGEIIPELPIIKIERTHKPYMIATAHYVGEPNSRQYFLDSKCIKKLVYMTYDEDYGAYYAKQVWNYGISQF